MSKKKKKKKVNNKKNRNNILDNEKTIKFIVAAAVVLIGVALFVVAFKDTTGIVLKSEYAFGEVGYIDDIEVTLTNASYINNDTGIEVTFEITNKRDNTITITPDDYFVFYDINQVQIPNKYSNDKNIIKKDETVIYKLQYDVTKKELYEIYFYSQIVENNVKFSFKASDISSNTLVEENVTPEKEIEEEY